MTPAELTSVTAQNRIGPGPSAGMDGIQDLVNGIAAYALVAAVAAVLLGGMGWALGSRIGIEDLSTTGRRGVLAGFGLAFLVGISAAFIHFFIVTGSPQRPRYNPKPVAATTPASCAEGQHGGFVPDISGQAAYNHCPESFPAAWVWITVKLRLRPGSDDPFPPIQKCVKPGTTLLGPADTVIHADYVEKIDEKNGHPGQRSESCSGYQVSRNGLNAAYYVHKSEDGKSVVIRVKGSDEMKCVSPDQIFYLGHADQIKDKDVTVLGAVDKC